MICAAQPPICLRIPASHRQELLYALDCGHVYHEPCIYQYCSVSGKSITTIPCPICKRVGGIDVESSDGEEPNHERSFTEALQYLGSPPAVPDSPVATGGSVGSADPWPRVAAGKGQGKGQGKQGAPEPEDRASPVERSEHVEEVGTEPDAECDSNENSEESTLVTAPKAKAGAKANAKTKAKAVAKATAKVVAKGKAKAASASKKKAPPEEVADEDCEVSKVEEGRAKAKAKAKSKASAKGTAQPASKAKGGKRSAGESMAEPSAKAKAKGNAQAAAKANPKAKAKAIAGPDVDSLAIPVDSAAAPVCRNFLLGLCSRVAGRKAYPASGEATESSGPQHVAESTESCKVARSDRAHSSVPRGRCGAFGPCWLCRWYREHSPYRT